MINILYGGNQKVFDGLITSILSIVKTCKEDLGIYVLTVDLTSYNDDFKAIDDSQIKILDNIVKNINNNSFVKKIDLKDYANDLLGSANVETRYSPYAFLRLYADELDLPEKIIYFDVDIMVYRNIKELYDIDVSNVEYGAVLDYYGKHFFNSHYINSGVLLLNLKKIKETGLFRKTREICHDEKIFLPDQTALNKLTTSNIILPRKFNCQKKMRNDTVIRHFSMTIKFFPYFHTLNIKQWEIEKMHKKYKCHEFDDILNEYLKIKQNIKNKGDTNNEK